MSWAPSSQSRTCGTDTKSLLTCWQICPRASGWAAGRRSMMWGWASAEVDPEVDVFNIQPAE
jgi:hypothetical protein